MVLPAESDAATANWGANYRMPTKAEWNELINSCTWTYQKGDISETSTKMGYLVSNAATGASIFLPSAGSYSGTTHIGHEGGIITGSYWASTCEEANDYADYLDTEFYPSYSYAEKYVRKMYGFYGLPVRAVSEQATE